MWSQYFFPQICKYTLPNWTISATLPAVLRLGNSEVEKTNKKKQKTKTQQQQKTKKPYLKIILTICTVWH